VTWLKKLHLQPWWIEGVSIGGLLLAIAIAGLVGLGINARVKSVTDHTLKYDIELEDRGDDFRVAVLDMRHYHRNIVFVGPSRHGLAEFEAAYEELLAQIDQLEKLGLDHPRIRSPEELRQIAERYYEAFRPAIDLYFSEPQAFTLASDDGLVRLSALGESAGAIDQLGELEAAAALHTVDDAANSAQIAILAVLGGLILVGGVLAYLVVRNSSEQKRTALELAKALQLKSNFIADASHELRTPLTVLRANADVALGLEHDCVHTEFLEEIVHEAERMTRLVEDLLFLARSDAGAAPLDLELVNIGPFLANLAERASVLAQEYDNSLHAELAADGLTQIDRSRIEQVVLILVDNAAKYNPAKKAVTLRSSTRGSEVVIEVIDRGPGIPGEDLPLIFERFYRGDKSRTRKQGGVGLGLAIAKTIVEAHGGQIDAESVQNKGTKMRLTLPLVLILQPATQPIQSSVIQDAI
jgi:signal transduction histidine kinase